MPLGISQSSARNSVTSWIEERGFNILKLIRFRSLKKVGYQLLVHTKLLELREVILKAPVRLLIGRNKLKQHMNSIALAQAAVNRHHIEANEIEQHVSYTWRPVTRIKYIRAQKVVGTTRE